MNKFFLIILIVTAARASVTFNGSSDKLSYGTANPVGATSAWSAFAWVYQTSQTANQQIISKRSGFSSGNNQFTFAIGNQSSGSYNVTISKNAQFTNFSGTSISANTWTAVGVSCDNTSARGFKNGVVSTTTTQSGATTPASDWSTGTGTTQTLGIGVNVNEGSEWFAGRLAYVALWNVKLTDAEQAILALGFSPILVRPQNLVFFAPLFRDGKELHAAYTVTPTGTGVDAHPRVYR